MAAGVPAFGVVPPPPEALQPASKIKPPTNTAGRKNRLVRGLAESRTIASVSINMSGPRGKFMGTKLELAAVVVTMSMFPLMEHEPFGIEQLAVRVGWAVNPDSLI